MTIYTIYKADKVNSGMKKYGTVSVKEQADNILKSLAERKIEAEYTYKDSLGFTQIVRN